jgi:hypothetical protein
MQWLEQGLTLCVANIDQPRQLCTLCSSFGSHLSGLCNYVLMLSLFGHIPHLVEDKTYASLCKFPLSTVAIALLIFLITDTAKLEETELG